VYYEDTDAGGIVYHASYLKFAERARTELVRDLGVSQQTLLTEEGAAFAVRSLAIEYLRPARLDDLLVVETRVDAVGGASLEVEQVIRRDDDDTEVVRLTVRLGYITRAGRPARIPAALRARLGR